MIPISKLLTMKKPSILKRKRTNDESKSSSPSTKRSVSFAATTKRSKFNNNEENYYEPHNRDKAYDEMSSQEEDALDPINHGSSYNDDGDEDTDTIRNAKLARATKRNTGGISFDDTSKYNSGHSRKGDSFQGEEDVDERFSLLHDSNGNTNIEQNNDDIPIEPFNLKSEREDGMGYFDGDTYVFRRNNNQDDEEEDAWLDNLDSNDQQQDQSTTYTKISNKVPTVRDKSIDVDIYVLTKEQAFEQIIPMLATDEETVMQALSRYGAIVKREKSQKIKDSASFNALNKITEICNLCMMKFDDGSNIYENTKSKMQQFLNDSDNLERLKRNQLSVSDQSALRTSNEVQWEYKGNEDNLIHGPYSTQQMIQWTSAGYFVGSNAVDVRIVSNNHNADTSTEQKQKVTVDDLLDDLEDSDNEETPSDENKFTASKNEWLRSDAVNFGSYLG